MLGLLSTLSNIIKSRRFDAWLEEMEQRDQLQVRYPELVTVNDCQLAYQMGYNVHVRNGRVQMFTKRKHR